MILKKIDYNTLIDKMNNINYDIISEKKFNLYLNQLAPSKQFPRFIPLSFGMNYIYKFVKNQIFIFIYFINSKSNNFNLSKIKKQNNDLTTRNIFLDKSFNFSLSNNTSRNYTTNYFNNTLSKTKRSTFSNLYLRKINEKKRFELKNNILSLNDYNYFEDKKNNKRNYFNLSLALSNNLNDISKFFNKDKSNSRNYKKESKLGVSWDLEDKNKMISMISNNKIGILSNLDENAFKKIFD